MWRTSSGMALGLMIAAFIIWSIVCMITAGKFEIKPTQMILKSDGCSYMRQIGVTTKNSEDGSNCTVNVPYMSNSFRNGGVIVLDDGRQIRVADNQVVIVGSIENQPWTPSQDRSAILLGASSILLIGAMAWFFILINK